MAGALKKAPQGRKWTVETHPRRKQIVTALIKGEETLGNISERMGISKTCLHGYLREKLCAEAAIAAAQKTADGMARGEALISRIEGVTARLHKLYDALDEELKDPACPEKYFYGPRSWEIDVVYKGKDGLLKRERLDRLLSGKGVDAKEVYSRTADPRKMLAETAAALGKQLELLAKIQGMAQGSAEATVNVVIVSRKEGADED